MKKKRGKILTAEQLAEAENAVEYGETTRGERADV